MDTLAELREWFLKNPDERVEVFMLADKYLQAWDLMGAKAFRLPREAVKCKPIIECFAGDPRGYADWLRTMRNTYLPRRGNDAANALAKLIKVVDLRGIARDTRNRENLALTLALKTGIIQDTPEAKRRYIKRIQKVWGAERVRRIPTGFSQEERSELVKEFWAEIDAQLERGEVPEP